MNTKENQYTVLKNQDIMESLNETERQILNLLLNKITQGKGSRKYYVVNTDEPYANEILGVILEGEDAKQGDYRVKVKGLLEQGLKAPCVDKVKEPLNRISFDFKSYPLLGNMEEEIESAIGDILAKLQALEIHDFEWSLTSIDRFRDTFTFKDVIIGEIEIGKTRDKMVL